MILMAGIFCAAVLGSLCAIVVIACACCTLPLCLVRPTETVGAARWLLPHVHGSACALLHMRGGQHALSSLLSAAHCPAMERAWRILGSHINIWGRIPYNHNTVHKFASKYLYLPGAAAQA